MKYSLSNYHILMAMFALIIIFYNFEDRRKHAKNDAAGETVVV